MAKLQRSTKRRGQGNGRAHRSQEQRYVTRSHRSGTHLRARGRRSSTMSRVGSRHRNTRDSTTHAQNATHLANDTVRRNGEARNRRRQRGTRQRNDKGIVRRTATGATRSNANQITQRRT